jgi:DNA adenine methylase
VVLVTREPFLKCVGGKRKLLPALEPWLPPPAEVRRYRELFAGGAAVFFGRYAAVRPAILADVNRELVDAYTAVRDDLEAVLCAIRAHAERYRKASPGERKEHFHEVRSADPRDLSLVERAARLIFLNKTSFNGLVRYDRRGRFNASFGFYERPALDDEAVLRAASAALQGVELRAASYEEGFLDPPPAAGDLYYLDPPYVPLSDTARFTTYAAGGFTWQDQGRLLTLAEQAIAAGAVVVLSNANVPEVRHLYRGLHVGEILGPRSISARAASRGVAEEVVASNRPPRQTQATTLELARALEQPIPFSAERAGRWQT